MNWTSEYPTIPGYTGDDDCYALAKFTSAEWLGPISPPEDNDATVLHRFIDYAIENGYGSAYDQHELVDKFIAEVSAKLQTTN